MVYDPEQKCKKPSSRHTRTRCGKNQPSTPMVYASEEKCAWCGDLGATYFFLLSAMFFLRFLKVFKQLCVTFTLHQMMGEKWKKGQQFQLEKNISPP